MIKKKTHFSLIQKLEIWGPLCPIFPTQPHPWSMKKRRKEEGSFLIFLANYFYPSSYDVMRNGWGHQTGQTDHLPSLLAPERSGKKIPPFRLSPSILLTNVIVGNPFVMIHNNTSRLVCIRSSQNGGYFLSNYNWIPVRIDENHLREEKKLMSLISLWYVCPWALGETQSQSIFLRWGWGK